MSTQPEALRLADVFDKEGYAVFTNDMQKAAAELRRLHALNAELLETLGGILKIGRGSSGRIIIEGWQEDVIRSAIAKAEGCEA